MTKEEYLALGESRWEALQSLDEADNFYDYEKGFDAVMVDLGKAIRKWVAAEYPKATQILDFYHAKEHLAAFAKFYFKDKDSCQKWIEKTGNVLKKAGIKATIKMIKQLEKKTATVENERTKLLNYCQNNYSRMHYPRYIRRGLLIKNRDD